MPERFQFMTCLIPWFCCPICFRNGLFYPYTDVQPSYPNQILFFFLFDYSSFHCSLAWEPAVSWVVCTSIVSLPGAPTFLGTEEPTRGRGRCTTARTTSSCRLVTSTRARPRRSTRRASIWTVHIVRVSRPWKLVVVLCHKFLSKVLTFWSSGWCRKWGNCAAARGPQFNCAILWFHCGWTIERYVHHFAAAESQA